MWPYTQTTGGNLLAPILFGTVAGGCSLAGWTFLDQGGAVWSAVPDPLGGVEKGNCVAQLTNAASSTLAQAASRSLALSPGFYSVRCNVAATDNNSAQLSIQYVYAGQRHAADRRQARLLEPTRMTRVATRRQACGRL